VLETGFIDHITAPLMITINYGPITDLRALQITTVHAKSFQSAVTNCFPVTDLNSGDSSASILHYTD
jgi:hypothetical protein